MISQYTTVIPFKFLRQIHKGHSQTTLTIFSAFLLAWSLNHLIKLSRQALWKNMNIKQFQKIFYHLSSTFCQKVDSLTSIWTVDLKKTDYSAPMWLPNQKYQGRKHGEKFRLTLKSLIEEQTGINEQAWKKVPPCLLIY